jgi:hypothetical protein
VRRIALGGSARDTSAVAGAALAAAARCATVASPAAQSPVTAAAARTSAATRNGRKRPALAARGVTLSATGLGATSGGRLVGETDNTACGRGSWLIRAIATAIACGESRSKRPERARRRWSSGDSHEGGRAGCVEIASRALCDEWGRSSGKRVEGWSARSSRSAARCSSTSAMGPAAMVGSGVLSGWPPSAGQPRRCGGTWADLAERMRSPAVAPLEPPCARPTGTRGRRREDPTATCSGASGADRDTWTAASTGRAGTTMTRPVARKLSA